MTSKRPLLPLVALLLAASLPASGADSARFRYRLHPGASYDATLQVSLAMQLDAEGLPEDIASTVLAGSDIAEQVRVRVRLDVSPAAPDGTTALAGKFEDLYTKMTVGGATLESSDFKDKLEPMGPLEGRVSADGRAIELVLSKTESALPGPARDAIGRLLHLLPTFPDRELVVGDRFEVPLDLDLPAMPGSGDASVDGTCVYTLARLAERDADFELRCTLSALQSDASQNMKMSIKGGSEGSARFDRIEGIFRTLRSELDVEMAMEAPGEAGSAEPRLVKIHASAKGPLELRMERVPGLK